MRSEMAELENGMKEKNLFFLDLSCRLSKLHFLISFLQGLASIFHFPRLTIRKISIHYFCSPLSL